LALVILTPIVGYTIWTYRARAQLKAAIAAIPADEPLTTSELTAWYAAQGAGEPDITEQWLAALAPFGTAEFEQATKNLPLFARGKDVPLPGQIWPEEQEVVDAIGSFRKPIDELLAVSRQPGTVHYPFRFDRVLDDARTRRTDVVGAARLLGLCACVALQNGKADESLEAIRATLRLVKTLKGAPSIANLMERTAIQLQALRHLQLLIQHARLTDSQLDDLQRAMRESPLEGELPIAWMGERAECYSLCYVPQFALIQSTDVSDATTIESDRNGKGIWRAEDAAQMLVFLTEAIRISRLPYPESFAQVDRLSSVWESLENRLLGKRRFKLANLFLPGVLSGTLVLQARAMATRDVVDCLLAIKRHELQHGTPPASLRELVPNFLPDVPLDPFDKNPLRYRQSDGKCAVYSIGVNGVDDGGRFDVEVGHHSKDEGFSLTLRK
jgi:hypothetical protein